MGPHHAVPENPTLNFEQDLQLLEHLDQLGFSEAWIGEHHSGGFEIIASPELFVAMAAARTKYIRLGTGVMSLPYHNPLMAAGRIVQLDHMTRGRFMVGIGPGSRPSDALMMGIDPAVQRDRMAEGIDVLLRLLRGESVTEKTEWYQLNEARLQLAPYSVPYPEIAVTSAFTPSGARVAGKHDLGMLCVIATMAGPGFDSLGTNWQIANDIAAEQGRTMDPRRLRILIRAHLAETRELARQQIRHGFEKWLAYSQNSDATRMNVPAGEDPVEWFAAESGYAVIGTPDDAIAQIEKIQKRFPDVGCILLSATDWANYDDRRHSYELYAKYVIPRFEQGIIARQQSYGWVGEHGEQLGEERRAAARAMFAKHEAEMAARGKAVTDKPAEGEEITFN